MTDAEDFVRRNTRLGAAPLVPEIALHLADEAIELWQLSEDATGRSGLPPPFWAFAWAGGQALARWVLDNPEVVAGRQVLDFAAGSGIVAIAARRAGAAGVVAAEIDDFACAAIRLNATANRVSLDVESADLLSAPPGGFDVVLAGDVFYERPMADRVLPFLRAAVAGGATVLVGDPGRNYLPTSGLEEVAAYDVPVPRAIEDADSKRTRVLRLVQGG